MQLLEQNFQSDRSGCPRKGCGRFIHKHGSYLRNLFNGGIGQVRVQRFWCPLCRLSISVLPADCLPYRPVSVERMEQDFDQRADLSEVSALDPPVHELEGGCLQRAWKRFSTRINPLKNYLGQIISATADLRDSLWQEMRQTLGPLQDTLNKLAVANQSSLLGDYMCLRLPGQA